MSPATERLVDLRQHLTHLQALAPRVPDAAALRRDFSLRNDVMFSLLMVCQHVIDLAGELCARAGLRFETYTDSVRALADLPEFPAEVVRGLEPLPGFRNVLIHEYAALDLDRAVEALHRLGPVEDLLEIVRRIERDTP